MLVFGTPHPRVRFSMVYVCQTWRSCFQTRESKWVISTSRGENAFSYKKTPSWPSCDILDMGGCKRESNNSCEFRLNFLVQPPQTSLEKARQTLWQKYIYIYILWSVTAINNMHPSNRHCPRNIWKEVPAMLAKKADEYPSTGSTQAENERNMNIKWT